jgi:hypothetical protein
MRYGAWRAFGGLHVIGLREGENVAQRHMTGTEGTTGT